MADAMWIPSFVVVGLIVLIVGLHLKLRDANRKLDEFENNR